MTTKASRRRAGFEVGDSVRLTRRLSGPSGNGMLTIAAGAEGVVTEIAGNSCTVRFQSGLRLTADRRVFSKTNGACLPECPEVKEP